MCRIKGSNPTNVALFSQISSSFKDDNRIDKKELKALNELVASSDLSPEVKKAVGNLLESAKKASDGFLWIFGRDISNKELGGLNQELGKLKQLVGDNAVGKELCDVIESSLPKSNTPTPASRQQNTNNVTPHQTSSHSPVSNLFKDLFKPRSSTTNTGNMINGNAVRDGIARSDISSFHINQYSTGLPSKNGDCGPTSGAMILRAFGVDSSVADVRNNAPGKPSKAPWALGENQISSSVEKLSGGAVKSVGTRQYSPSDKEKIMNDIKSQLAEGKLLMLCTGVSDANFNSRHYIVITGIDSNGNLQIADPAQPSGSNGVYISPDALATRMANAKGLGRPTTITTFQRNN